MRKRITQVIALTLVAAVSLGVFVPSTPLSAASPAAPDPKVPERVRPKAPPLAPISLPALNELPLQFEANVGQAPSEVRYFARMGFHRLLLTDRGAVLDLRVPNVKAKPAMRSQARRNSSPMEKSIARMKGARQLAEKGMLRMHFVGGAATRPVSEAKHPGVVHYYVGKDPKHWRTNVPTFGRVRYHDVYPGIDVVYYGKGGVGKGGAFEYDLIVAPGADPRQVRIAFEGAEDTRLAPNGDLILTVGGREVFHRKPVIYQEIAGVRRPVDGRYVLAANGEVGFEVGAYVASAPLVIDPEGFIPLGNNGYGISEKAVGDPLGNSWVTGFATSTLPDPVPSGSPCVDNPLIATDAFLVKLEAVTNTPLVTIILGGRDNGFNDCSATFGLGLALDATAANVIVVGATDSANMVVTDGTNVLSSPPAFQQAPGDDTCFLNSLQPSNPFYQAGGDGFVVKIVAADNVALNLTAGDLVYATYLGGNLHDVAQAVTIDNAGNAYVTGGTQSQAVTQPAACPGQPVVPVFPSPAYDGKVDRTLASGGFSDIFLAKINPAGSVLSFVTLQGGTGDDAGIGVVLNTLGEAVVSGDSLSIVALGASISGVPPANGAISATVTMTATEPKSPQVRFTLTLTGPTTLTTTLFDRIVPASESPTLEWTPTGLDGVHTLELTVTDPTGEIAATIATVTLANGVFDVAADADAATRTAKSLQDTLRIESMFAATDVSGSPRLAGLEAGFMLSTVPCPDKLPLGGTYRPSNYKGSSAALLGAQDPNVPYVSDCDAENSVIAKFSTASGAATAPPFLVGGSNDDQPVGIAVDASNNVYLAGQTASADFPTKNDITGTAGQPDPAKERLKNGEALVSGFVMKVTLPAPNTQGAPVQQYSSLLGGSGETTVSGLAVTPAGTVYLAGVTTSTDEEVNVVPRAPGADTPTAYIIQIPPPPTTDTAPVVSTSDQLLTEPVSATSTGTLSISADVDGNVIVAGAPGDDGLGLRLTAATLVAKIDIKPKAKKNNINLSTKFVQVAILSTPFFDAPERIDQTITPPTFGKTGNQASFVKCDKKGRKVDKDKLRDLVCTFRIADTKLKETDTFATLKAKTKTGRDVEGTDAVTIVPKKKGDKGKDFESDDSPFTAEDDD